MSRADATGAAIDPATLRRLRTIRPGSGAVAEIELVVDEQGRQAVLKSFRHRGRLFRRTAGAFMARREITAYRRLRRLTGIPHLHGRVGCDGILIEYVECTAPGQLEAWSPAEFFRNARALLEQARARGVLHGDVCRNLRIDRAGRPWLMDFGASFVVRPWLGPVRGVVLRAGRQHDERAVAVLQERVAPESLTWADREILSAPLPWQRTLAVCRRLVEAVVAAVLDRGRRRSS